MDRTKKLLASVTASALLSGTSAAGAHMPEVNTTTNRETAALDPQSQAEQAVLTVLRTVEADRAMTVEEIVAQATSLTRTTAEQALRRLTSQHKVARNGNGQPYRYYNPQATLNRKVAEATSIIKDLLSGVPVENARTMNELLAQRPDLERSIADKVISDLVSKGDIRRTGDNSQSRPYRYYDRSRGGYGG